MKKLLAAFVLSVCVHGAIMAHLNGSAYRILASPLKR
jgi:hypothetical protein